MKATHPRSHGSRDAKSRESESQNHSAGHAVQTKSAPRSTITKTLKPRAKSDGDGGYNGEAKHLNPDASPALAAPGTVEADRGGQRTDEQLITAYRSGDRT